MCKFLEYISDYFCTNTKVKSHVPKQIEKECVICLEKEHLFHSLQHIDKFLYNRRCACEYYIHEKCFRSWHSSQYQQEYYNAMNCLICNSNCKTSITPYKKENIGYFEMAIYFLYRNNSLLYEE